MDRLDPRTRNCGRNDLAEVFDQTPCVDRNVHKIDQGDPVSFPTLRVASLGIESD